MLDPAPQVPSERLCLTGTSADLGQLAASAALALARAVTGVPLLIVKANTIGKYLYVPAQVGPGLEGREEGVEG